MKGRFSKYNDVDVDQKPDGSRVCNECKLNYGKHLKLATIEDAISHLQRHADARPQNAE